MAKLTDQKKIIILILLAIHLAVSVFNALAPYTGALLRKIPYYETVEHISKNYVEVMWAVSCIVVTVSIVLVGSPMKGQGLKVVGVTG